MRRGKVGGVGGDDAVRHAQRRGNGLAALGRQLAIGQAFQPLADNDGRDRGVKDIGLPCLGDAAKGSLPPRP